MNFQKSEFFCFVICVCACLYVCVFKASPHLYSCLRSCLREYLVCFLVVTLHTVCLFVCTTRCKIIHFLCLSHLQLRLILFLFPYMIIPIPLLSILHPHTTPSHLGKRQKQIPLHLHISPVRLHQLLYFISPKDGRERE